MARLPHPPNATRFFARVLAATCECPRCGLLLTFGKGEHRQHAWWNHRTSRLTCPGCQLVVVVGLLAWPVERGWRQAPTRPTDQVPDERQLAQLRAEGSGWWMLEKKPRRRAEDTNVTAWCSCVGEVVSGHCPIHGGER